MRRRLFISASLLSLVLCVAAFAMMAARIHWGVRVGPVSLIVGSRLSVMWLPARTPRPTPLVVWPRFFWSVETWKLGIMFAIGSLGVFIWPPAPEKPAGFCKKCGYNLTGNTSGVCPECGTPVVEEAGAKA